MTEHLGSRPKEVHLGGATFDSRLRSQGLIISEGWNYELAKQLVEGSTEPLMLKMVPRDALERFKDVATALDWHDHTERTIYRLNQGIAEPLLGAAWFSQESYDGADRTMAVRVYEDARRLGVAYPFLSALHYHQERFAGYKGDFWLEVRVVNAIARHLYEKLGYTYVDDPGVGSDRVRMKRPGVLSRLRAELAENQKPA